MKSLLFLQKVAGFVEIVGVYTWERSRGLILFSRSMEIKNIIKLYYQIKKNMSQDRWTLFSAIVGPSSLFFLLSLYFYYCAVFVHRQALFGMSNGFYH